MFSIFDPTGFIFIPSWVLIIAPLLYHTTVRKNNNLSSLFKRLKSFLLTERGAIISSEFYLYRVLVVVFFFILGLNTMGLLPYVQALSSHISLSLPVALACWLGLNLYGWSVKLNSSFTHLVPLGCPNILIPLMVLIELISLCIRPLTLGVRLAANITAGHLIILLVAMGGRSNILINLNVILRELIIMVLETRVAVIQPYVFFILLILYTQELH